MRLPYACLTVITLSIRRIYGGYLGSSDVIYSCSKYSGTGDAAVFNIVNNEIRIFLMVPRVGISLC